MRADVGKIMMTPKGAYSPNTQYEIFDLVTNEEGSSYLAKAPSKGVPLTNTDKWEVLVDVAAAKQDVSDLKNAVVNNNSVNVLSLFEFFRSKTYTTNNVTFSWNDDNSKCTIETSEATSKIANYAIFSNPTELPPGIKSGESYDVEISGWPDEVYLSITDYTGGTTGDNLFSGNSDGVLAIPDGVTGISILLRVAAGTSIPSPGITIDAPVILTAKTNKQLQSEIEDMAADVDDLKASTNVLIGSVGEIDQFVPHNIAEYNNRTAYKVSYTWEGNVCHVDSAGEASTGLAFCNFFTVNAFPLGLSEGDRVYLRFSTTDSNIQVHLFWRPSGIAPGAYYYGDVDIMIPSGATGANVRLEVPSGVVVNGNATVQLLTALPPEELSKRVDELESLQRSLKILCIGNSYTQDAMVYAPYIIKELLGDWCSITLGISYYSGAKINQYIDFFDNDSAVLEFDVCNDSAAWTSQSGKTLKWILEQNDWDIITFQQGSTDQGDWSTFSNLNGLIDRVIGYTSNYHKKPVKAGWISPQLRLSVIETVTYEKVIECVQKVLETTPIDFVVPVCTAIQNARGTSLNSIGAQGGLTADNNGHLQEGLPVLLAGYVSALKIMEIMGRCDIGILGDQMRPDKNWVLSKNIPGKNWTADQVVVGVTDANCYLAQKCAVAAIKKPFEISTIV